MSPTIFRARGLRFHFLSREEERMHVHGDATSGVELSNVSQHGLWLLVDGKEYYLAFSQFPWFRDATIVQLSTIERPQANHLHWPDLDVDLTLEMIERPEAFPLVSRKSGRGD